MGEKISLEQERQREVPPKCCYFTVTGSCSVKTVAGMHILAAYYNNRWRRAFRGYQDRWP